MSKRIHYHCQACGDYFPDRELNYSFKDESTFHYAKKDGGKWPCKGPFTKIEVGGKTTSRKKSAPS